MYIYTRIKARAKARAFESSWVASPHTQHPKSQDFRLDTKATMLPGCKTHSVLRRLGNALEALWRRHGDVLEKPWGRLGASRGRFGAA